MTKWELWACALGCSVLIDLTGDPRAIPLGILIVGAAELLLGRAWRGRR